MPSASTLIEPVADRRPLARQESAAQTRCLGRLDVVAILLPFHGGIRGDSAVFGGDESEPQDHENA